VGSANGNASLAASAFITLVSTIIIVYLNRQAKDPAEKIVAPAVKKAMKEQQLVDTVADLQAKIEELRKALPLQMPSPLNPSPTFHAIKTALDLAKQVKSARSDMYKAAGLEHHNLDDHEVENDDDFEDLAQ
jgi:hypothetical protein